MPSATTAVVAAARAAAEVVCLTGGAQSHFMKEDIAAVIIQATFRGYLVTFYCYLFSTYHICIV